MSAPFAIPGNPPACVHCRRIIGHEPTCVAALAAHLEHIQNHTNGRSEQ